MTEEVEEIKVPKKMGRPPSFTSAQELWNMCLEYFQEWEKQNRPLTVVGLTVFLDICRDTFAEYAKGTYDTPKDDFSDTIKKAKDYIECHKWEKALTGEYKAAVAIFDLKNNHGARDVMEHVTKGGEAITQPQTIIVTESTIKSVVKQIQDEF